MFPQSSGGMRRAEYTITRLSSCRRPAEGKRGESWAGGEQSTDTWGDLDKGLPGWWGVVRIQTHQSLTGCTQAAPEKA